MTAEILGRMTYERETHRTGRPLTVRGRRAACPYATSSGGAGIVRLEGVTDHLGRVSAVFDEHLAVASARAKRRWRRSRSWRQPSPIALTTDTSALTAIGNDYSFADVFARQTRVLAAPGDPVVRISTSGRAENVIRGIEAAKACGAMTWALTGGTGARLREVAHRSIVVPSDVTARIQEMHITIIHAVRTVLDERIAARRDGTDA